MMRVLEDILRHVGEAIFIEDSAGQIVFFNQAAEQLFGYSREEIAAGGIGMLLAAEVIQQKQCILDGSAASDQDSVRLFSRCKTKSEEEIDLTLTIVPLKNAPARGRVAYIASTAGNFGGEAWAISLAHELRGPLSVLASLACLMDQDVKTRHIQLMKKQIQICESIVQNMIAFVSTQKPELQTVNLQNLFQEVRDQLSLSGTGRLQMTVSDTLSIRADLVHMRQALVNLVRNALEALEMDEGEVRLVAQEESDWVKIQVIDSGPGIPEAIQRRLFEPFVTTKENGLGLGLATARRLVETNGGKIATQTGDQGTTFTILLPWSAEHLL